MVVASPGLEGASARTRGAGTPPKRPRARDGGARGQPGRGAGREARPPRDPGPVRGSRVPSLPAVACRHTGPPRGVGAESVLGVSRREHGAGGGVEVEELDELFLSLNKSNYIFKNK